MTNRRGFLSAILAGAAAPAVVKAASLMKMVPTESGILTYKMSGRYDLDWMENQVEGIIWKEPTQIILPATMMAQAMKILNAEFDKAYTQYRRRA